MLSPAAIQADHAPQPDGVFLSLFVIKEGKIKIPHIVCAPTPHITQATSNLFPPRTLPPAKKMPKQIYCNPWTEFRDISLISHRAFPGTSAGTG